MTIVQRTKNEREAYLDGLRAALNVIERHGAEKGTTIIQTALNIDRHKIQEESPQMERPQ